MTYFFHGRDHRPLTGALLALLAMSFFSWQDALIKFLASDYSLFQILFIRSGVIVLPLFCILYFRHGIQAFHTTQPFDHAKRVVFNLVAFLCFYYSITRLELAQATAIALSAPLILSALSGPLLGERVEPKFLMTIVAGFIGVILVIQPGADTIDWIGTCSALIGALSFALLSIQTRKMAGTERTDLMVFYAGLTFFCLMGIIVIWHWTQPTGQEWLILCGVGLVSLIAQLCIVQSFQFAPAYFIAPFEYVAILWALILGWLIFAEIPTSLMLLGAGLIVVSGLMIVRIERRNITSVKLHTDR